ncbi:SCO5918 family protein [Yinghuangia sp. ASG 101]|uniref:SCO5918 family protein n=1 Tax=Yinghuangia sp. ASG 101 TaxID=2896848 RepID=UPI001E5A98EE|nr:SCO5918 family protein [Yinghuangia sp. ASG 101]UGQ11342.1 SCO5918 family protein [Yinghuangia sp. ASG 101]
MRCVIAGFAFDLSKDGVLESMKGVKPEPVTGGFVVVGRRRYPVKQVGAILTRQDRRDFTADEVTRAMARLGFTCGASDGGPTPGLTPLETASAMLGTAAPA